MEKSMLFQTRGKRAADVFVIKHIKEIASEAGTTVEDARNFGPSYSRSMDRYAGVEVTINHETPGGGVMLDAVDQDYDGVRQYEWSLSWLVPKFVPTQAVVEAMDLSAKEYDVTIGDDEFTFVADRGELGDAITNDGFIRVDISKHMDQLGASDWYLTRLLSTSDFGSGERNFVWVNASQVIPHSAQQTPST